jgi:hypothetical protein
MERLSTASSTRSKPGALKRLSGLGSDSAAPPLTEKPYVKGNKPELCYVLDVGKRLCEATRLAEVASCRPALLLLC